MKIGVVGSGISGLSAAYYLNKKHDVTVFEANDYVGGHTDTHQLEIGGKHYSVDSGFIVFNEQNYTNFVALLKELGVAWQDSDMSFSVRNDNSRLEYGAENIKSLFCQKKNILSPGFYRMLMDIKRFYREAPLDIHDTQYKNLTLDEYLCTKNYSIPFMQDHIFPMTGALWSASPAKVKQFPLRYLVGFMKNHKMMQIADRPQWKVIKGGSNSYVEKIVAEFKGNIKLNTPVNSIERFFDKVIVHTGHNQSELFDQVVLACHADQALKLLNDPSTEEASVLSGLKYQENSMILHSDNSVMPTKKAAWSSWNSLVPKSGADRCFVTYYMNKLQNISGKTPFFVTLNPTIAIDEKKIWAERTYHHPIYTNETLSSQERWAKISGKKRTHFCGAYWGWGFHEDGVRSAVRVVDAIDSGILDKKHLGHVYNVA